MAAPLVRLPVTALVVVAACAAAGCGPRPAPPAGIPGGTPEPAQPAPAPPPAVRFEPSDVEFVRAELHRCRVGEALLRYAHPTGRFTSATTPEVNPSADRRELAGRVTVNWAGTSGAKYSTTFAFTLTGTVARLRVEADTAVIRVAQGQLRLAEIELARIGAEVLAARPHAETPAKASPPVRRPAGTGSPFADQLRTWGPNARPTPPRVTPSRSRVPGAPAAKSPPVAPVVGVWDVALTPAGAADPLPARSASFNGDGRFAMGADLGSPTIKLLYRYGAEGLSFRRDEQAAEDLLPMAWDEEKGAFNLVVPQGTLTFRRRPVGAAFHTVKAEVAGEGGKAAVEVLAALRVDHAPGLPVEVVCRVYDDDGRPVRAKAGSAHADGDGLLLVVLPLTPRFDWTEFEEFRLPVPVAELPDELAGREVRFTLAVRCPRDGKEVTREAAWGTVRLPDGRRPAP